MYRVNRPRETLERKLGRLRFIQGDRASVLFRDGTSYALPADPFRKLGLIVPGTNFVMVVTRKLDIILDVRIEALPEARPSLGRAATPPVYVRTGRKVATRR